MRFRLVSSSLILASLISISACGRKAQRGDPDKIDLDQNVTVNTIPRDPIFSDFKNNWKKFVSEAPEFTMPVARKSDDVQRQAPEPVVLTNCVLSPDAGGYVPEVTIIWTEPTGGGAPEQPQQPPGIARPALTAARQTTTPTPAQDAAQAQTAPLRFDLAIHYNGFERNFFSTALSTQADKRFNLPANSELVRQEDALLLTGPSLFPKLMNYKTEVLKDRDTNRDVGKQTLVLRDLSQGLSYSIRMSSLRSNQWLEVRDFGFLTPVCPKGF